MAADLALVTANKVSPVGAPLIQLTLVCGADITAGDMVVINKTTGKWAKADANVVDLDDEVFLALLTRKTGMPLTAIRKGIVDGFDLSALNYGQRVYLSATAGKLSTFVAPVKEVQTVTVSGTPTGGSYKLSLDGEETASIAFDAAASAVQSALEALANVGVGGVAVTGSAGGPYTVTFQNQNAGDNVSLLVISTNALTGGTAPTVAAVEATAGVNKRRVGFVVPANNQPIGSSPDKLLFVDL